MFIDDLTTLRIRARLTIAELAKLAEVSRDTISRIEKHKPSSLVTLCKIIDALNAVYFINAGEMLTDDKVTKTSKYNALPNDKNVR